VGGDLVGDDGLAVGLAVPALVGDAGEGADDLAVDLDVVAAGAVYALFVSS